MGMIRFCSNQTQSNCRSAWLVTAVILMTMGQFAGLCLALYGLLLRGGWL
jgi:hypothetical protein